MKAFSTLVLALALLLPAWASAQTCDLVFFTDDGAKFTLVVDGETKNDAPATRVVATGIRNETPMVIIRFEDAGIPQLRKSGYFPLGMEYTVMVTTNKKGERVLRPTGEAALGTAAKAEPAKPKPTEFVEDAPVVVAPVTTTTVLTPASTTGVTQTTTVGGVDQVTTVVVVEEEGLDSPVGGENVNISMGVNGVGFNMNVQVDDSGMNMNTGTTGTSSTTRTTTRTTTTTTTATPVPVPVTPAPAPVREPEVYRMPGYSGPIGCGMPMSSTEFSDAKKSVESKSFEDTRMTMAKQIARDRCFSADQVKDMLGAFSFEDTRLEFAKFAYDRTHDIGNYYKVNDAFTFESSIEELTNYIGSR